MESGVVLNNQTHESNYYSKLGAPYNKWKTCKLSICNKAHERKKPSRIHLKIYDEKLEKGEQMEKKIVEPRART